MRWLNLHIVLCVLSVVCAGKLCAQQHVVSVQSSTHGEAQSYSIDHGATVTLLAIADFGYRFVQWSDGVTANPRNELITEDASFVAMFQTECGGANPTQHTVTVCANDCSTPHQSQYIAGTVLKIVAQPNVGYRFKQWSDGNTNNPRIVTINSDVTYHAEFEAYTTAIPMYSVCVKDNNGSTNIVRDFPAGTELTLIAQPIADECNSFGHWEDASTATARKVVVNSDSSYIATFEIKQYSIITEVEDETQGSVSIEINQ